MSNAQTIVAAEQYVRQLFDHHKNDDLVFHGVGHTEKVVMRTLEIAAQLSVPAESLHNLTIAAWFHDTGHLFSAPAWHEEKSVEVLKEFNADGRLSEQQINTIANYIMATKMPTNPTSLEEKIICDADTYHFGTKEFKTTNKQVKAEWIRRMPDNMDLTNWNVHTYDLLMKHKFYTEYCSALLAEGKQKNIDRIKEKLKGENDGKALKKHKIPEVVMEFPKEENAPATEETKTLPNENPITENETSSCENNTTMAASKIEEAEEYTANNMPDKDVNEATTEDLKTPKKKKKKKEADTPEALAKAQYSADLKHKNAMLNKGIQTMLRLTSENHLKLSDMADNKASILISVNAIIISVILSVLLRRLEVEPHLTIPTIIFLVTALTTIVVSILATRPKVTAGNFKKEDVTDKKTNLLFFGNFHRSTLEDYQWAMGNLMNDYEYLYSSIVQDIYYLGEVLGKKYRLVRLAYTVFMIGLLITVVAFIVAIVYFKPANNIIQSTSGSPF